jgi:tetratricopeptide (TPR) repeat protein
MLPERTAITENFVAVAWIRNLTLATAVAVWLGHCSVVLGYDALQGLGHTRRATPKTGVSAVTDSISSGIKKGFGKFSDILTPKTHVKPPPDDPISLSTRANPRPELYLAWARTHEQAGNLAEAEKQYRQVLIKEPGHLKALLAFAHLKDRQGQLDDAVALYRRAAKAHPREAVVRNHLGLCYARRNMFNEAVAAMKEAVRLQPNRHLYRHNIAAVLVEMGHPEAAFSHLRAVHKPAVAHYNLGHLLQKHGQKEIAARHFAAALRDDPSLSEAQVWLRHLQQFNQPPHPQKHLQQFNQPPHSRRPAEQVARGARDGGARTDRGPRVSDRRTSPWQQAPPGADPRRPAPNFQPRQGPPSTIRRLPPAPEYRQQPPEYQRQVPEYRQQPLKYQKQPPGRYDTSPRQYPGMPRHLTAPMPPARMSSPGPRGGYAQPAPGRAPLPGQWTPPATDRPAFQSGPVVYPLPPVQ